MKLLMISFFGILLGLIIDLILFPRSSGLVLYLMEKIDSRIVKAKVAYISNAKWRKLFIACEEYTVNIGCTLWKFVGHPTPIKDSLCVVDLLFDDERFADCPPAPYAY